MTAAFFNSKIVGARGNTTRTEGRQALVHWAFWAGARHREVGQRSVQNRRDRMRRNCTHAHYMHAVLKLETVGNILRSCDPRPKRRPNPKKASDISHPTRTQAGDTG